ncbi:hypothetical protein CMQ_1759 [Grosmannia clavigera kw1407]|uniref:Uncharacterized protein n=1 Tax=Grosmannia clavigera (strain kw1407 / UAMH 11150) TaxID=655863 RepID=F0XL80_GROCL|nr:uncharacterized protein CMQ_1759 [Grosmannia clavigera kw1407]EFX01561.1 hypothetical protein CMQ_1759 [Grosmannia clavigera kw1407]
MHDEETDRNRRLRSSWELDELFSWDAVETNWLKQITLSRVKEDKDMHREYGEEATALRAELVEAISQHTRLTEALLQARVLVDEKHADLDWLDDQFEKRKQSVAEKRTADDMRVKAWIANARAASCEKAGNPHHGTAEQDSNGVHSERAPKNKNADLEDSILSEATTTRDEELQFKISSPEDSSEADANKRGLRDANFVNRVSVQSLSSKIAGVEVVGPDGIVVGTLKRLIAGNHWVQKLRELPIRRSVEIRMGRKLTQDSLDDIHESSEPKKSKWLSFMIQATGEIQGRACHTCTKGQGLYSLCIIVGGSDFPRCGNCEWNKQGCHGAAAQSSGSGKRPRQSVIDDQFSGQQHSKQSIDVAPDLAKNSGDKKLPAETNASANTDGEEHVQHSHANDKLSITPPQTTFPGKENLTPAILELKEITKDSLVLKDDGMIFLEPEIMRGVPIRKITPEHAYWEPDWKRVEVPIRSKLDELAGK